MDKESTSRNKILLLVVLTFLLGLDFFIVGDGSVRFLNMAAVLFEESVEKINPFSMVGSWFSLPLWIPGILLDDRDVIVALVSRYNFILLAGFLFVLWKLLKPVVSEKLLMNFLLILMIASMFPAPVKNFYGEVFTTIAVSVGIVIVYLKNRKEWMGWGLILLGVVNTPASVLGFVFLVIKRMLERKRWRYLLVLLLFAGLYLVEAQIRTGNAIGTNFGYSEWMNAYETEIPFTDRVGFNFPFGLGLLSILFSFGTGLLFFVPGLFVPLIKHTTQFESEVFEIYKTWIIFIAGLVLVYANWYSWHGGWVWGPRFFLIASVPASFVLASRLNNLKTNFWNKLVTLGMIVWSFYVAVNAALIEPLEFCLERMENLVLCWYVPQYSVLINPWINPPTLDGADYAVLVVMVYSFWILSKDLIRNLVKEVGRKKIFAPLENLKF